MSKLGQSNFSVSKISRIFAIFFSLKNAKMGDKLLLITNFDNFDFQSTLFSKNAPKFCRLITNQAKSLQHFYGHFHRPLA